MPMLHLLIWCTFLTLFALNASSTSLTRENPLTAKASLIRYWNRQITNNLPKPSFLLSKASPLNAVESAFFTKLASQNAISTHLSSFCSSANLVCDFRSRKADRHPHRPQHDANFTSYSNKQFINYGASRVGSIDSFKNYSVGLNMPTNSFVRYSPASTAHSEKFTTYSTNANVGDDGFSNYDQAAAGGSGDFSTYEANVNVPKLRFTSYDSSGKHHKLTFSTYTDDANSGSEAFVSYSKNGNAAPVEFANYAATSNIVGSTFNGYGESSNAANNSFKGYGSNSNNPNNNFKSYANGVNTGVSSFESYRDGANVGAETFQFYSRNSNSVKARFSNYGNSFNEGSDQFTEYGKGSTDRDVEFKSYGVNNTFKGYGDNNKGVTFAGYIKRSPSRVIEEGKFFREAMLTPGTVIKMPDIRDKMPRRSFLPRSISSKLPFSSARIRELKGVFGAEENSTMVRVMGDALAECERGPSPGERKRCVGSIEDMIDFAVEVLGRNVVVRTTENVNGSGRRVVIGAVKGINGGEVTKSVSCHQSLFPYLLYYCHSVPKVRVYEVEIMELGGKKGKVNDGVAVCHLDTSEWSGGHGAFVALGSGPGLIEVCHWIFENDMTWARAD